MLKLHNNIQSEKVKQWKAIIRKIIQKNGRFEVFTKNRGDFSRAARPAQEGRCDGDRPEIAKPGLIGISPCGR
jgi:hypothetical protein